MTLKRKEEVPFDPNVEMNNPQLQNEAAKNAIPVIDEVKVDDDVMIVEEHRESVTEENSSAPVKEEVKTSDSITPIEEVVVNEPEDTTKSYHSASTVGKLTDKLIVKKDTFSRFINGLEMVVKGLKKVVVFNHGVTYFITNDNMFICKFDLKEDISLMLNDVEKQCNSLKCFLYDDNIYIEENDDEYIFYDHLYSLNIRKAVITDPITFNEETFNKLVTTIRNTPEYFVRLGELKFDEENELARFISTIKIASDKGIYVKSRSSEKLFDIKCGNPNSNLYNLYNITYDSSCIKESIPKDESSLIDTIIDLRCFDFDFKTLNIEFYYRKDKDQIYMHNVGELNNGASIDMVHVMHRNING